MPLWKREGAWKWNKVRIPALWCKTYSLDVRGYGQSYKINIRLINAVSLHSCVISLYAVDVSVTHWRYIWQDVILSCFNYISLSEIDNAVRRCQLFYHPISQVFIKIRCKRNDINNSSTAENTRHINILIWKFVSIYFLYSGNGKIRLAETKHRQHLAAIFWMLL